MCDDGYGVGDSGLAVFLDFEDIIKRTSKEAVEAKYGNLFEMYQRITGENPYERPMRIYPAPHYTMGGLWVDYNLQSNIPGLFVLGEANFSDHGANRLGASALMQGLADGYFVAPYTIGGYLGSTTLNKVSNSDKEFKESLAQATEKNNKLLGVNGKRPVDDFHRELGQVMWEHCGMARNEKGLTKLLEEIPRIRDEFWNDVSVVGGKEDLNVTLEKAGRVADFLEMGELMALDALTRKESCGGHFREESQTEDGEAKRDDENFKHVAAWEFQGVGKKSELHKEELDFEYVKLTQRSYK
jgi:succinate dehydrogenase / fumarate reductase flavoprotein subunit